MRYGCAEAASSMRCAATAEDESDRGFIRSYVGRRGAAPSTFSVFARSVHILQDRISRSRLAGDPPDVTVAPRLGHVGYLEFYRAEECIAAGEEAARRALPEIYEAMRMMGVGTAAWSRKAKNGPDAPKSADNVSA